VNRDRYSFLNSDAGIHLLASGAAARRRRQGPQLNQANSQAAAAPASSPGLPARARSQEATFSCLIHVLTPMMLSLRIWCPVILALALPLTAYRGTVTACGSWRCGKAPARQNKCEEFFTKERLVRPGVWESFRKTADSRPPAAVVIRSGP